MACWHSRLGRCWRFGKANGVIGLRLRLCNGIAVSCYIPLLLDEAISYERNKPNVLEYSVQKCRIPFRVKHSYVAWALPETTYPGLTFSGLRKIRIAKSVVQLSANT